MIFAVSRCSAYGVSKPPKRKNNSFFHLRELLEYIEYNRLVLFDSFDLPRLYLRRVFCFIYQQKIRSSTNDNT